MFRLDALRNPWLYALLGCLVSGGVAVSLNLPSQMKLGEKGQEAIQMLDAMRDPFLDIKEAEVRLMKTGDAKSASRDFAKAVESGNTLIVRYQQLAEYNPELSRRVAQLLETYQGWVAAERHLFDPFLDFLPGENSPASREHILKDVAIASSGFLSTMARLGYGEEPIHADIDGGRRATHVLLLLMGSVFCYLIGLVLLGQRVRRRLLQKAANDLELLVETRTADLGEANKSLQQEIAVRKRVEEEIQRDRIRLTTLQDINTAAISTLDLGGVLNMLLDKIDVLLPYAASGISLFNRETGKLERLTIRNLDEKALQATLEKSEGGLGRIVLENKAPLVIRNVQKDARLPPVAEFYIKYGFVSYLGLPLIAKGEVIGVLSLLTREEHEFSPEEIEFISTLAGQAAIAIQNSELFEQTKKQAAELEKAKEMQADFAAMIAHDLRSPLTATLSTATMLEDGLFGTVTEEQKKWLVKVQSNIRNLVDLVNDFLDLSKLEAGHIQLSKEKVHMDQLIRESADNYRALAGEKKISLRTRIDPALPHINADPRRLDQVLSNLLSNAIKFTPEGGEIEVGAAHENGVEAKLWVRDTGMGIPPQETEQIFQKYRQASGAKEAKEKGTGLGLVICKMIVEAHGGKIRVDSEEGKGSTFTVTIPLEQ